uniref:Uncharacterized protein n=1 Tax=Romanomermis culicivorax TaxID=13658 RepID=A0A915I162_ROMCU
MYVIKGLNFVNPHQFSCSEHNEDSNATRVSHNYTKKFVILNTVNYFCPNNFLIDLDDKADFNLANKSVNESQLKILRHNR